MRPTSVSLKVVRKRGKVDVIEPDGVELPPKLLREVRKILRSFHHRYGIEKPITIRFREGIEWGWEDRGEVVIGTGLSDDQTLLMVVHELAHLVLKMRHDYEGRKLGYRSFWRRYRDRDTFSEKLANEILGRKVNW